MRYLLLTAVTLFFLSTSQAQFNLYVSMRDMLGINSNFKPRFLRQYLQLSELVTSAVQQYINDIKSNDFPNDKESY